MIVFGASTDGTLLAQGKRNKSRVISPRRVTREAWQRASCRFAPNGIDRAAMISFHGFPVVLIEKRKVSQAFLPFPIKQTPHR